MNTPLIQHHPDCPCCNGFGASPVPPAPATGNNLFLLGAIAAIAYLAFKEQKKDQAGPVVIPRKEAIEEHERLTGVLQQELDAQKKELEQYKAGNPSIVRSPRDEKIWRTVERRVKKQQGVSLENFNDLDWGLVTEEFKNAKNKYEGKKLPKKYHL